MRSRDVLLPLVEGLAAFVNGDCDGEVLDLDFRLFDVRSGIDGFGFGS